MMLQRINQNFSKYLLNNSAKNNLRFTLEYFYGKKPKCFVVHPVPYPNKGPLIQQYLSQQAIGLVSSLNWEVIRGPFDHKSKKNNNWPQIKSNQVYLEPLYGDEIKDGTYVDGTLGKAMVYKQGLLFDADESDQEEDFHKQWKDKLLRQSLGTSSLTRCKKITQKFYFTKGKVQQLVSHVLLTGVQAIFINTQLKPGQIRNLKKIIQARMNNKKLPHGYGLGFNENESETELETLMETQEMDEKKEPLRQRIQRKQIRIFDRFSIILQIFAQRSTSKLAKLQIQLSYFNYLKTRLVRDGSTYSSNLNLFSGDLMKSQQFSLQIISAKQRRALGMMSGEGQSQLQMQKRNIRNKQAKIRKQIEDQVKLRNMKKQKQKKRLGNLPVIALIGYTNVGKSALMNKIMKKQQVQSKDLLFQTLKTTTRHIILPSGTRAILLDTIGFITNLPVQMIDSFKSTLEDIIHADLVIHLRDISHPQNQLQKQSVIKILKQLNFDEKFYTEKMIEVWNKVDLISQQELLKYKEDPNIKISCSTGTNVFTFLKNVDQKIKQIKMYEKFTIEYSFDKHYDILQYLKNVGNIPHQQIQANHNYQATQLFPNGSVSITINTDENNYWKLMKFIQGLGKGKRQILGDKEMRIMSQKQYKKNQKGMPPKEGW